MSIMQTRPPFSLGLGALTCLLALSQWSARGHSPDPHASELHGRGGPTTVLLFRASGISDRGTAASVIHCTNVGTVDAEVGAVFRDFNGTVDCSIVDDVVGPSATTTLATRDTLAFFEDVKCPEEPGLDQGSVVVFGDSTGSTDVICTVQVVDPTSSTPRFLSTLDLYDPNGTPIDLVQGIIFADGFETGDLSAWSGSVGR